MFQAHVSHFSHAFIHMLQMFYLDVSKVDRVLHLSLRFLLSRLGVPSSRLLAPAGHPPPAPILPDAGDVRGGTGPVWAREMVRRRLDTPSVWTLASPYQKLKVLYAFTLKKSYI